MSCSKKHEEAPYTSEELSPTTRQLRTLDLNFETDEISDSSTPIRPAAGTAYGAATSPEQRLQHHTREIYDEHSLLSESPDNSFTVEPHTEQQSVETIDLLQHREPAENRTVFVANVHHDVEEAELQALFSQYGTVTSLDLLRHRDTGRRKGYGFVVFDQETSAQEACQALNSFSLREGMMIYVRMADTNTRLFLGNIPKCKTAKHLMSELQIHLFGLKNAIVYKSIDGEPNRGFCFLDFNNHQQASSAMSILYRKLSNIWNCPFVVDWADPLQEPGDDVMGKVKIVYISNIAECVTEDHISLECQMFGEVERVKKIKHYAFVHFKERSDALEAIKILNGKVWGCEKIKVVLSKPPIEKKQREELLRRRENRKTKSTLRSELSVPYNLQEYETLFHNETCNQISRMSLHELPNQAGSLYYSPQSIGDETSQLCRMLRGDQQCSCSEVTPAFEMDTSVPTSCCTEYCERKVVYPVEPMHMMTEKTYPCRAVTSEQAYGCFQGPRAYCRESPEIQFLRESNLQMPRKHFTEFRNIWVSGGDARTDFEDPTQANNFQCEIPEQMDRKGNSKKDPGTESRKADQDEELLCQLDEAFVNINDSQSGSRGDASEAHQSGVSLNFPGNLSNKTQEELESRSQHDRVKHCTCCEFGARSKISK